MRIVGRAAQRTHRAAGGKLAHVDLGDDDDSIVLRNAADFLGSASTGPSGTENDGSIDGGSGENDLVIDDRFERDEDISYVFDNNGFSKMVAASSRQNLVLPGRMVVGPDDRILTTPQKTERQLALA